MGRLVLACAFILFAESALAQPAVTDSVQDAGYAAGTTWEIVDPLAEVERAAAEKAGRYLAVQQAPDTLVAALLELGQRKNVRQRVLRDAWRPLFLSDDDVDRFLVYLNRKVGEKRLLRDRYFRGTVAEIKVDEAYDFAEARVHLTGIARIWFPRTVRFSLSMSRIEGVWYLRGPELSNIDLDS